MSSGKNRSNETDCHFNCDDKQMAGPAGAIKAKWYFVHPIDKTAAGVCLDPRHRGRRSAPSSQRPHPLQLLGRPECEPVALR